MAKLPSVEDLKKLPLRAVVAYAARNARRVQPLYQNASVIEDHKKHSLSIDTAIKFSLRYANRENINEKVLSNHAAYSNAAAHAAHTVFHAVRAAVHSHLHTTTKAYSKFNANTVVTHAASAATHAADANAALLSHVHASYASYASINKVDYQKLLSMNLSDDEGIDGSENGPLGPYWPKGKEPDWYKELYPQMRTLQDEPNKE